MDMTPREPAHSFEKVCIQLPDGNPSGAEVEWFWAEPLLSTIYALRNVPFYAYGLSYDDRVRIEPKNGRREVVGVVGRSGHSTYRLITARPRHEPKTNEALENLHLLRCDLEPATDTYVAVDVLPEADIYSVYRVLEEGEHKGIWDFEEAHCGHLLRQPR